MSKVYVPWASSAAARNVMRANRKRDTGPELHIRRALHALGFRFNVARRPWGRGSPVVDILFPRKRLAIFVDGCFWHGCSVHYAVPRVNTLYWKPKIERNRKRDAEDECVLRSAGWTVVRIWEHESTEVAVARIVETVQQLIER